MVTRSKNRLLPVSLILSSFHFRLCLTDVISTSQATCEDLRLATEADEGLPDLSEASLLAMAEECKVRDDQTSGGNATNATTTTEQQNNQTKSEFFEQFIPPNTDNSIPECGVYLAPSTIPGAGLGMFAGKRYDHGDQVTDGDIIIPLGELDWHNDFELETFLWEEYTWAGSSFPNMEEEVDFNAMQGCSSGIGAAINCMLPLVNVIDGWSSTHSGNLHRSKHPGAGAISIFHDRKAFAYRNIQPGEELFIDYGENYFESREEIYGLMPLHQDYEEADELLAAYNELLPYVWPYMRHRKQKERTREFKEDLYDLIKNFPMESRTLNALPENHTQIPQILRIGTAEQYHKRSIRDLSWLDQHGKCMDNIRPGQSTIEGAGRGVFATRAIQKGSLVTPAPLIHIKDKEELRMYDLLPETEDGYVGRNSSNPNHWQLLLNYVYGHPESKILLSPYGMFNGLMNHHGERANTKIAWSKEMRHPEWMEQDPDLWTEKHVSGLLWDFVATRDILPGEEIFIDYGQPWQDAWNEHQRNWVPPKHAQDYIPGYQIDQDYDTPLRTEAEGGYGPFVKVYCRSFYLPKMEQEKDYYNCRIVHRYPDPKKSNDDDHEFLYIAELTRRVENKNRGLSFERVFNVFFDLPRDAFHFLDQPYTRDHQQTWSFRHEIMIPDEIFPEAWKNKK